MSLAVPPSSSKDSRRFFPTRIGGSILSIFVRLPNIRPCPPTASNLHAIWGEVGPFFGPLLLLFLPFVKSRRRLKKKRKKEAVATITTRHKTKDFQDKKNRRIFYFACEAAIRDLQSRFVRSPFDRNGDRFVVWDVCVSVFGHNLIAVWLVRSSKKGEPLVAPGQRRKKEKDSLSSIV